MDLEVKPQLEASHQEYAASLSPQNYAQAWRLVLFISALSILSLLDRNIMALFLDNIRSDLLISEFQASLIYGGAFAITFSLMGLPMGWAVDRRSRRKVIFVGVSFWSLSTVACGLVTTFPGMLLARTGVGAGEAALVPSAQSIIADTFPVQRRTLPLSFYAMGQAGGAGIALLIGGCLAAVFLPSASYQIMVGWSLKGWQLILILVGLPGCLIAGLIFLFREPPRPVATSSMRGDHGYRAYLHHARAHWRYFTGHHLGFIAAQSTLVAAMSWTPTFLMRVHGWTQADVGFWFGTTVLVGPLVGLPLHGWICDKFHQRGVADIHLRYQMYILPVGVSLMCLAYLVTSPGLSLVLLGFGITVCGGSGAATAASLQQNVSGELRGKAASVWMLVGGVASFAGPSGVALINEHIFGSGMTIGFSIAVYMAGALVLALPSFELARRAARHIAI